MSNFTARTRLRGEVVYYRANWQNSSHGYGKHSVLFVEGPHKGETYPELNCAIAKDDKYLLGERNDN